VTTSSTNRLTTDAVLSPTRRTRSPSMIVFASSSVTTSPDSTLRFMAGAPDDSTPNTRMSGFPALSDIEFPEISPPPPIGMTATSTSGQSSRISSPRVP